MSGLVRTQSTPWDRPPVTALLRLCRRVFETMRARFQPCRRAVETIPSRPRLPRSMAITETRARASAKRRSLHLQRASSTEGHERSSKGTWPIAVIAAPSSRRPQAQFIRRWRERRSHRPKPDGTSPAPPEGRRSKPEAPSPPERGRNTAEGSSPLDRASAVTSSKGS